MAIGTLTNTTIANRYKSLLKITGTTNDVLGSAGSEKYVEDGDGNNSVLSLSTGRVGIGTTAPATVLDIRGTVNFGVNSTGYDIKIFGDSGGGYVLWDGSADSLIFTDSYKLILGTGSDMGIYHDGSHSYITNAVGTLKIATETDGIDVLIGTVGGGTTILGSLDVGVSGTGHDVTFYSDTANAHMKWNDAQNTGLVIGIDGVGSDVKFLGDTSGKYMEWDQSANQLDVTGSLDVTGDTTMVGTLTVGVDNTGHDVKFFGDTATNGYMLWDQSTDDLLLGSSSKLGLGASAPENALHIQGSTATAQFEWTASSSTTSGGVLILSCDDNALLADTHRLGAIEFRGSEGASDTLSLGAWIGAVASETWHATENSTSLVFHTESGNGAIAERMRITKSGNLGIGTIAPSGLLEIYKDNASAAAMVHTINLANGETSVFAAKAAKGGTANRETQVGVYYNSSSTSDEPCSYIRLDTGDGVTSFMWIDDDDDLTASATVGNIGTGTGAVVGDDMTSDERLKDISSDPFPYGLAEINNLTPIKFKFKDVAKNVDRLGFGAQTTKPILPEVVKDSGDCIHGYDQITNEETGILTSVAKGDESETKLTMQYNQIIPVLVKAVQELSAKVTALENA